MSEEQKTIEQLRDRITKLEGAAGLGGLQVPPAVPERVGLGGMVARRTAEAKWAAEGETNELAKSRAQALGKPGGPGLGVPSDTIVYADVFEFLCAGSPRLALARALGVPFAPYMINVRADFTSTSQTDIPSTGSDVKVVQDTLVDQLVLRITNQSSIANLSVFQAQSDFFFNFQSGLEATLDVQGAPRYAVAPRFCPLATLCDAVNGSGLWPRSRKWVLTYQQQLFMAFHASVNLPFAPLDVTCSYRSWVPVGEAFVGMTNREAMDLLASKVDIVVSDAYRDRLLSV
jgi:hypothetical protein